MADPLRLRIKSWKLRVCTVYTPSPQRSDRIKWRLGILAAVGMAFLALVPQLHLWLLRGNDWQGSYASFDFDEIAYSSYLSALISGRPRRNDPYTGRNDQPEKPLPESLHSIQFVPAYATALPARFFNLSAGTTFIVIRVFGAITATLALFWLLALLTRDELIAASGAIVVLCLGGLAGEPNDAYKILSLRWLGESLPFLRRYVPALVFPLFFVFVIWIWQALHSQDSKPRLARALLAAIALALLIFSYFFLWTAAIAWLLIIALLWLIARGGRSRTSIFIFAIVAIVVAVMFIPYAYLLQQRAPSIDAAQLLTRSRAPILSLPVVIGLVVLAALALAVWRRWLKWRDPAVIFTASFALLPVVTFNQQVITGLLLQPVHYGRYSANYISVLAVVLTIALSLRKQNLNTRTYARVAAFIGVLVFAWALLENGVRSYRLGGVNSAIDDARRVAFRLRDSAPADTSPTNEPPVVLSTDLNLADALPNDSPHPVLWSPHLFVFSGSTASENRERLYQYLYYSDVREDDFARLISNSSFVQLAIFGWERMNQKSYAEPISGAELQRETQQYATFLENFNATTAASPRIGFVVVPATGKQSLNNLDRWYRRDSGEHVSDFVLYRVALR